MIHSTVDSRHKCLPSSPSSYLIPHTLLDRSNSLLTASFKIVPKQANILGRHYPHQHHAPLLKNHALSNRSNTNNNTLTSQRPEEAMCVLTPYQFTCADPFGDHVCGSGYYFHFRAVCHRTPACTKYYTAPIMLSTSCGVCEQVVGYYPVGTGRFWRDAGALTSCRSVGSCEAFSSTSHTMASDDTAVMSQRGGNTTVEGVASKLRPADPSLRMNETWQSPIA